ncbi:ABC transporter permease [Roseicyclus marinus]|uniref:ABC transporter permease n=1 Tax=Roseicyclus marinus TaxID=2161673 RepID=UPI002410234D|nr:ABC transporter permease [Roseicyclus marinus]MDG3040157.1 ABC transporter permease [Roseicyclus marinus]
MEPLTWSGDLGPFLNPVLALSAALFAAGFVANFALSLAGLRPGEMVVNADRTLTFRRTPVDLAVAAMKVATLVFVLGVLGYVLGGMILADPLRTGILGGIAARLTPVWLSLALLFGLSIALKRRLGLYGKLFDSPIGMIGLGLVIFWVFSAVFSGMIATHGAISVISGMRNEVPGTPLPSPAEGQYAWYLLGGDALGRDVFSRVIYGAFEVLKIAPLATLFAFMVGITLGLPAGYFGGRLDTIITFLANLVLAFPVILLFYLLVTPEIVAAGIPNYLSMVLFIFPIIFMVVLFNSRFRTDPPRRNLLVGATVILGGLAYLSLISNPSDPELPLLFRLWPEVLDLFDVPGNLLIVFVSVVFVNSPTVFRIVRGIVLDIKTRDYVAAGQTRGEGPWYIMLWEMLPNARGPLIVDFCLRIGYTTILLGTLGFFGLGVSPESPDWGSTINEGRRLLTIYPHPALPPALALMSLVLGLNLLADGLREESLKD